MDKQRILYLDFIRTIATISIVITHFNAIYVYSQNPHPEKAIIAINVFNIYFGSFGVALFFIISGAALMHVYENKFSIINFFKKRFFALYPMFWIAYLCAFFYYLFLNKGLPPVPKVYFFLTIIGFDGYLAHLLPTFYILGEWFLGGIIILYLVFPVLLYLIKKVPLILGIAVLALYFFFMFHYPFSLEKTYFLFIRLPEFLFGMYFIKYIKQVRWYVALPALATLILNSIFQPQWIDPNI